MDSACELRELTSRLAATNKPSDGLPGFHFWKAHETTGHIAMVYEPMLYFVLQGAKQLSAGDQTLTYGASSFMILSVEVPVDARVLEASTALPFLGIELRLGTGNPVDSLLDLPKHAPSQSGPAFGVGGLTSQIVDILLRLGRLLDTPEDLDSLAPLYTRELLYRIAQGPEGLLLRNALGICDRFNQLRRAITEIKNSFSSRITIDELADIAGMSVTSFHRHFKAATGISPGVYHKRVRLHEARRLLLVEENVSNVAFSVGYESATQFNREFARQFGITPGREARRLRGEAVK